MCQEGRPQPVVARHGRCLHCCLVQVCWAIGTSWGAQTTTMCHWMRQVPTVTSTARLARCRARPLHVRFWTFWATAPCKKCMPPPPSRELGRRAGQVGSSRGHVGQLPCKGAGWQDAPLEGVACGAWAGQGERIRVRGPAGVAGNRVAESTRVAAHLFGARRSPWVELSARVNALRCLNSACF